MKETEYGAGGGGAAADVAVSVPPTPEGTPAPLFPSRRIDSMSYERASMPRCNCFPNGIGFGSGPAHSCGFAEFKAPDVTLTRKVPAYIAAQVAASILASLTLKGVFHPFMSGGVTVPSVSIGQAFALEFLITFNLMFVVTAVATDTRAVGELAGIAVGATVMLNILVAGPSSGGSMNPVRTLGPAVAAGNYKAVWIYLVAPTLGALAGAAIYKLVQLHEHEADAPRPVRSFRR
ncbi:hypothetical protein Cgig2_025614 [Carnegiea gigantea]|uniref:Uncharacterized protein n=1 Tax=Carnegiea gigantea TaxID=171969 RepID=A0A9Q1JV48_9CARY|nr:hypothetical protein Cgig2_025614 [Carnegiea gigantea]